MCGVVDARDLLQFEVFKADTSNGTPRILRVDSEELAELPAHAAFFVSSDDFS